MFLNMNNYIFDNVIHDNSFLCSRFNTVKDNLNIAHFNCQSFNLCERSSKLTEIRNIFEGSLLNIVGVSETWLKPEISTSKVNFAGYSCCRNDRLVHRGGGVALYVSKNLPYNIVHKGSNYGVAESLFIEIVVDSDRILVGVVYAPHGNVDALECDIADLLVRYSKVIIMGDFNSNLFDTSCSFNVRGISMQRISMWCIDPLL